MRDAHRRPVVRRLWSVLALVPGVAVLLVAGPAVAAPPDGWEEPGDVSGLSVLLLLVGAPVLLFAVIAVLVYLPSVVRRQREQPTAAFGEQPEWFGGPRQGGGATVEEPVAPAGHRDKGGASADW